MNFLRWEWTESCQAKTSQVTPTSQPEDLPQSKYQIFFYFSFSLSMCFQCVYVHLYVCMFVIFRQVKQSNLHWRKIWSSALQDSLFIPLPISSISQMTESLEGKRAVQPNTSVTVSYQGCLSAQQMDHEDQSTGKALPSRQI